MAEVKTFDLTGKIVIFFLAFDNKSNGRKPHEIVSVLDPVVAIAAMRVKEKEREYTVKTYPISIQQLKDFEIVLRPEDEYDAIVSLLEENGDNISEKVAERVMLDVAAVEADIKTAIAADWADTSKTVDPVSLSLAGLPIKRVSIAEAVRK